MSLEADLQLYRTTNPAQTSRISLVFLSQGLNYIVMGHVDEQGHGVVSPHNFAMAFKTKKQRDLAVLSNVRC